MAPEINPSQNGMIEEKKSFRKRIADTTKNYSSTTTIHGISYLFSNKISGLERLLWVIVVILAMFFTTFQVVKLYKEWQAKPVITTLDTVALPIKDIEFPAVTICPQGSRQEIIDLVLFRQLKEYIQNRTDTDINLTQEKMMEQVEAFLKDVYPGARGNPAIFTKLMASDNPKMYVQNEAVLKLREECDPSSNIDIVRSLNKQLRNFACPEGYEMAQGSIHCIHEKSTAMTYEEASEYCNDLSDSKLYYLDDYEDLGPLNTSLHGPGNILILEEYYLILSTNNFTSKILKKIKFSQYFFDLRLCLCGQRGQ